MSERAEALAQSFMQAHAAFTTFVAAIPAERWGETIGDGELRSVGMVAHHVAFGYGFHPRYFGAIAAGQPLPPLTMADGEEVNARVALEAADLSQDAVLDVLRDAAEAAAGWIRGLSDEQLDRCGAYLVEVPPRSVEAWIEAAYLGHARAHLKDIRAALQRSLANARRDTLTQDRGG